MESAGRDYAESIVDAVHTPLVVLAADLRIEMANQAFCQIHGVQPEEVEKRGFFELDDGLWDIPPLRSALDRVLDGTEKREQVEVDVDVSGEWRQFCFTFCLLQPRADKLILLAIEESGKVKAILQSEVTGREQAETALEESRSALLRSRQELRRLSASLLNAHDAERRRVSRELHDDLGQKVAKLQFDIEILEQKVPFSDLGAAKSQLLTVRDQAAALSNDLRRVAHQLHPSTLDHLGLTVALRSYTQEFSVTSGIPVEFTSADVPRQIPIHIASCIYRIVQEALRNVGKHAGASLVAITLAAKGDYLALAIQDNGTGFDMDLEREKGGLGLIGMEERVRLVEGNLSIDTAPGRGVRISIHVPFNQESM